MLEGQIEELRGFESSYRGQLRTYIQGQLAELETTGTGGDPNGSDPGSSEGDGGSADAE